MTPSLFLRRFTILDFARVVDGDFHGESVYVDAELHGQLDHRGFLMDFGPVKKLLKAVVDDCLDHRLAVDSRATVFGDDGRVRVEGSGWSYEAPAEAFALIDGCPGVDRNLEEVLRREALEKMPANIRELRFHLQHDPSLEQAPSYRYTHGLKLHEGNCQRLLHGHRNVIEVEIDGSSDPGRARWLADRFADAHFVCRNDLSEAGSSAVVSYSAPQGEFAALMPAQRIEALDCEPSVENIAAHALLLLLNRSEIPKGSTLTVRAFEGLHKGAVVAREVQ